MTSPYLLPAAAYAHPKILRVVVWYTLLQSVLTGLWWITLVTVPEYRRWFWPSEWPSESLDAFALGDLAIIMVGGGIVAYLGWRKSPFLRPGLWLLLGAILYPTLQVIYVVIMTQQAWLGAIAMGMASIGYGHLVMAELLSDREWVSPLFRNATDPSAKRNRWVTFCQLILFWPLLLAVFPLGITYLERQVAIIPSFASAVAGWVGIVVFATASIVNLWTAWTMTSEGEGTPFPFDKTNRLVVRGTYAWVRNPMALTGLVQGAAVGTLLGSPLVIVYVICGAAIWQFLVRPVEEQMLYEQFGAPYADYCSSVPCWIPRFRKR